MSKDFEFDIHVWKKPGDDKFVNTYTISHGGFGICVDAPIDDAVREIREFIEIKAPR